LPGRAVGDASCRGAAIDLLLIAGEGVIGGHTRRSDRFGAEAGRVVSKAGDIAVVGDTGSFIFVLKSNSRCSENAKNGHCIEHRPQPFKKTTP
jgi:hypothetical protein